MSEADYPKNIPDQIIERAVELWCRALRRPKFDNGDKSWQGSVGMGLAAENARLASAKVADYAATVERFRAALIEKLKFRRDHHMERRPAEGVAAQRERGRSLVSEHYYFDAGLSSDYGPGAILAEAADAVGLPHDVFSYKSTVSINSGCVSASFGYAAPCINHYPLPDGRWLLTTLSGDDMPMIVAAVMEGRLPGLTVEPAARAKAEGN